MIRQKHYSPLLIAIAVACLSGCLATTNTAKPEPAPAPAPAVVAEKPVSADKVRSPAEIALSEGIALYNNGDYNGAIKLLATINDAEKPLQLKAFKYMAFSYCVTARQTLCKQQFEKAIRLDPSFDLEPGEKGHPLWTPVFDRVKKKEKGK